MKVLYKRIEKCEECPYFWYYVLEDGNIEFLAFCKLAGKKLKKENSSVPKNCPLPDEKDLREEG